MSSNDSLYLLADYEKYKAGKIDLLSAKSNILLSREKIKNLIKLSEESDIQKVNLKKSINKLKNSVKSFIKSLPKSPIVEKPKNKKEVKKQSKSNIPDPKKPTKRDEIKEELDAIQQKLAELGA